MLLRPPENMCVWQTSNHVSVNASVNRLVIVFFCREHFIIYFTICPRRVRVPCDFSAIVHAVRRPLQPRDDMERWDSVTDTWTVIPLLNRRTAGMAFVLGPVLVYAGGTDTVNPIRNVDFFTWNATSGANDTLRTAPWLAGVRQYAGCVFPHRVDAGCWCNRRGLRGYQCGVWWTSHICKSCSLLFFKISISVGINFCGYRSLLGSLCLSRSIFNLFASSLLHFHYFYMSVYPSHWSLIDDADTLKPTPR
jgi:hypothetical protein